MALDILNVPYVVLKSEYSKKSLKLFHIESSNSYAVFAGSVTYILKTTITGDDLIDFNDNLKSNSTKVSCTGEVFGKCSPLEADGKPLIATTSAEGLKCNKISPNWCDPTTWWYSSILVENETATRKDGYNNVYKVSHKNVIDSYHGKITGEDYLTDTNKVSLRVSVSTDGYVKNEQDPHYGTGGDFTINYALGEITFFNEVNEGSVVTVTYHYENGSTWIIAPDAGETLRIKSVECQFSEDIIMTDSLVYECWAYNPYDPPNKVQVVTPDVYKTLWDYINDANKAYPQIPIFGKNWRGTQNNVYVFSWDFQSTTDFYSKWGMELRVRLEHDNPFEGECCTGTFYCLRNAE